MSSAGPANLSNGELAFEVIQACWRAGCREFVVCAGSRNSPLVLQLLRLKESTDELRVWSFFEERSAAFFALGRSKASGAPTAVVTTSGTAATELLPAAVEAHYGDIPLILVTADRPRHFRRSGAPQAIEQEELFGEYVTVFVDASGCGYGGLEDLGEELGAGEEQGLRWHINVAFDEPLVTAGEQGRGELPAVGGLGGLERGEDWDEKEIAEHFVQQEGESVVLLGCLAAGKRSQDLVEALVALDCPVWAEASSGLRENKSLNPLMIKDEKLFFTEFSKKKRGRVLRIGGVPSLRFWRDLEDLEGIEVLSLAPPGGFSGLARVSSVMQGGVVLALQDLVASRGMGLAVEKGAEQARIVALLEKYPQSEPAWLGRLSRRIPGGSLVYLGNSMPIREWNLAATYEDRGLRCFASRGANGIDGQLSTFLGLAAGGGECWGVFGDLTTLYDLSAPWVLDQFRGGKRRFVVVNNGGGRIFSRLPHLEGLATEKKAVMENHHRLDFGHWAAMWKMEYQRVTEVGDLSMDGIAAKDSVVIELCPDLGQSEAFWEDCGNVG